MNYAEIAVIATEIHSSFIGDKLPISVISSNTDIKSINSYIKQLHNNKIDISIFRLDYQQRFIYGRLQRYDNEAIVYYSDKLNNCWSRYVATKELSHLILDKNRESLTTNMDMIVNWIISGLKNNINEVLNSETKAVALATELLIPYQVSHKELKDSSIKTYDIALKYSVPKRVIEALRLPESLINRDKAFE